ncbi:MAG: DUF4367 domain-containing protein, partial [Clostridia bacterium]|nr:DUF4367 domain-containing protein [Clostridia bacterium]
SIMFVTEDDVPTTIEVKRQPVIDEDGWTEEVAVDSPSMYSVNYYLDGTLVMIFHQTRINSENMWSDDTDVTIQEIYVAQNEGALLKYANGNTVIAWSDGDYSYSLLRRIDTISEEELLKIAETVH